MLGISVVTPLLSRLAGGPAAGGGQPDGQGRGARGRWLLAGRAAVRCWARGGSANTVVRGIGGIGAGLLLWIIAYGFLNPPITPYMIGERRILGDIEREWVPTERISPMLLRSSIRSHNKKHKLLLPR